MKNFNTTLRLLGAVAGILAGFGFNARAELSEAEAAEHLKHGALVVDVRTAEEFKAKHLTNVTNIPLSEVKEIIPKVITNQNQIVLLHCRTGRRSGIAENELRALGYTNVFNIGSFERAEKILQGANR